MNYLKDRRQRVVIGGTQSDFTIVKSGVPQGSILGPLFFVIFINDMFEHVSDGTDIALYADDTKIWRKIISWSDHEIFQNDIDALQNWADNNKMKFHPGKCKVLSVLNKASEQQMQLWNMLPFQLFLYTLNGHILDFSESEKDLGVVVKSDLSWDENLHALCQKASSRLGLMKRTLHFIKDPKQKRAFYLALVRSLFEHCSIIWRPTTITATKKVESIQKRAVKWILGEPDHHYNDLEYISERLRDLDLLPMESKFDYTDLVMFHKIYHEKSVVELPPYITAMTNSDRRRLRTNVSQPVRLNQSDSPTLSSISQRRVNRNDEFSLKSTVEAKSCPFKGSFFFRTHTKWNDLPTELKGEVESKTFQIKLKKHLWDIIIDPD